MSLTFLMRLVYLREAVRFYRTKVDGYGCPNFPLHFACAIELNSEIGKQFQQEVSFNRSQAKKYTLFILGHAGHTILTYPVPFPQERKKKLPQKKVLSPSLLKETTRFIPLERLFKKDHALKLPCPLKDPLLKGLTLEGMSMAKVNPLILKRQLALCHLTIIDTLDKRIHIQPRRDPIQKQGELFRFAFDRLKKQLEQRTHFLKNPLKPQSLISKKHAIKHIITLYSHWIRKKRPSTPFTLQGLINLLRQREYTTFSFRPLKPYCPKNNPPSNSSLRSPSQGDPDDEWPLSFIKTSWNNIIPTINTIPSLGIKAPLDSCHNLTTEKLKPP